MPNAILGQGPLPWAKGNREGKKGGPGTDFDPSLQKRPGGRRDLGVANVYGANTKEKLWIGRV